MNNLKVLAIALLVIAIVGFGSAAKFALDNSELVVQVTGKQGELNTKKALLDGCLSENSNCESIVVDLNGQISEMTEELDDRDETVLQFKTDLNESNVKLEGCESDLSSCQTGAAAFGAGQSACESQLSSCNNSLNTCLASADSACQSQVDNLNSQLSECNDDLSDCQGDLSSCHNTVTYYSGQLSTVAQNYAALKCCSGLLGIGNKPYYKISGGDVICQDEQGIPTGCQ